MIIYEIEQFMPEMELDEDPRAFDETLVEQIKPKLEDPWQPIVRMGYGDITCGWCFSRTHTEPIKTIYYQEGIGEKNKLMIDCADHNYRMHGYEHTHTPITVGVEYCDTNYLYDSFADDWREVLDENLFADDRAIPSSGSRIPEIWIHCHMYVKSTEYYTENPSWLGLSSRFIKQEHWNEIYEFRHKPMPYREMYNPYKYFDLVYIECIKGSTFIPRSELERICA